MISSWQIQSGAENQFTLNGKEYPATRPLDVRAGERFRIRWINISGEEFHTMHTHGHDQQIVARDAQPRRLSRTGRYACCSAPGQRVDVVVNADAQPGNVAGALSRQAITSKTRSGMPDGLITAIHYAGTPKRLVDDRGDDAGR